MIRAEFGIHSMADVDLRPRYNVCPGESVAAVVEHGGERRLGPLVWGFGPRAQVNVRSESVVQRAPTRDAVLRRRCLVLADGFYEWRKSDAEKLPFFFRLRSERPFALAGIWSRRDDGEPRTAILTRAANEDVVDVHDRMPVVFDAAAAGRWLDASLVDPESVDRLLREPAPPLEHWRVSTLVNSGRNDSPDCVRPAEAPLRLVPRDA